MHKKILIIIGLVVLLVILYRAFLFFKNIIPTATTIIFHRAASLQSTNGKIGILILGIGGGTHDGPNLTDTIMYASLDPKANKITLISIPRDLWVPDLEGKINTAYADGEVDGKHKGLVLAKSAIEKIIGQPIDYGFRIDFNGFVKAIDEVGGVDITVVDTLDDYNYPIEGKEDDPCGLSSQEIQAFTATDAAEVDLMDKFSCRFKHLHFDKGPQHMDGETALEFVRSRHGVGSEGTDFARSRRQHLVIEAFRAKLLSLQILLNPGKIISLYTIVKDSVDTDIKQEEIALFIQLAQKMQHATIATSVIDFGDLTQNRPGLLINPPISSAYSYASVLLPRIGDGNFSEIQSYVACEITKGNCIVNPTPPLQVTGRK